MKSEGFKQQLFAQFAVVAKAMANPNRLELLEFLAQGERTVEGLAQAAGLSVANTSQHLQQMRHAGLVLSRKEGLHVFYRLSGSDVIMALACLRRVAENHLTEVSYLIDSYLTIKDNLEPLAAAVLIERAREGLVTVLDVRPHDEYAAGHLPGAINIPLHELEQRLAEIPRQNEVVAYCRGPYCVLAFNAVRQLRDEGYRAQRLENGYPEWLAAGLPIER
jgi:rhodanese-related sulfurtransferase